MQRTFDTGAVIRVEIADAFHHMIELGTGELLVAQNDFILYKARRGHASEIENDFEQIVAVIRLFHGMADVRGEHVEQGV